MQFGLFGVPESHQADVQTFNANSIVAGQNYSTWVKRPGTSMVMICCWGGGGAGGNGVIGAVSTAGGGGGGASGSQTVVLMPSILLPDTLYVSVGYGGQVPAAAGIATRVAVAPNDSNGGAVIASAIGGNGGANGSGATNGAAGAAGTIPTATNMALAIFSSILVNQAGSAAGAVGVSLAAPLTGLLVTGGTGGAALGASGQLGGAGGNITVGVATTTYQGIGGGSGATTGTNKPGNGSNGTDMILRGLQMSFGGTGGGSSHGSATGTGLVGGIGGKGGIGCGGGGGGAALTGSTGGTGGQGGNGQVIIVSW